MSDQDLFNNDNNDQTPPAKTPDGGQPAQSPNYDQMLSMIVNGDGAQKYKSVDEALKGAAHAQAHIEKLEKELETARNSQNDSTKLEDLIEALKSKQEQDHTPAPESTPQITPDIIEQLVESKLNDISTKTTREQNITAVTSKFRELYGEKASETLYSKANDLGMSKEDINSLIASNPKAAFKVLGVDDSHKPDVNVNSDVNTENFNHKPAPQTKSAMGYVSTKELTESWMASKKKTLDRLNGGQS